MKNIINIIAISLFVFVLQSCTKKVDRYEYRYIGYIFNSNDSTPFVNTKFKFYNSWKTGLSESTRKTEEEFFYTDDKGYFDYISSEMSVGGIYWPSFYEGAAYTGPKKLGNGKREEQDIENKIRTTFYDTLYSIPYQ